MLLREEPDVFIVNLDLLTYAGNLASLEGCLDDPRHKFVNGSIGDTELVEALLKEDRIDGIINFAAESHVDRSINGPMIFAETNILGTMNLLQAAKNMGVKRYLQVSTDEVYGSLGPEGSFSETSPICPNSPYSASKAGADHMVRAFQHTYGIETIITRCSNNYGEYQFPEKMIPLCINNIRHDRPIPVYGDGRQVRDWLYVGDHCRAIWAAFRRGKPGEIYNIGGGTEMPNIELVKCILSLLGKPESLISFVADRPGHDRRYAIDSSKARRELDWKPLLAFKEGLARTVQWYQDNQSWLDGVSSGAYRTYYDEMYGKR
ncbi:MAG: dTDP-glucose 4,6-dehydratase [Lentisphaerae bacterium GWF2_52_8]|nr:MAG: dTDP-glucose 4,6-dehydratase [Lentisphaerae bacterium GWF2_52_8]